MDNDRFVLPSLKASIEELSDDMQVIWTTSDGGQAVTNCLTAATRPKVLLADMSMEGVSGIYVQSCRFPEPSWSLALNSAPVLVFLMLLILNFGQTSRNRSKLLEMRLKAERAEELGRRVEVARMIHDSVTGDLSNIARVSQRQLRRCSDPEQAEAWRQINEQSRRVLDGVHAVIRQLSTTDDDANASGGGDDGLSETLHERVAAWSRRLSEAGIRGDAVYTVAITLGERHAEIVGMNELPDGERDNGDIDAILDLPGGNGLRLRREEIEGLGGTMSVGQEDDSWVLYARVPYADPEQGESRARRRFR